MTPLEIRQVTDTELRWISNQLEAGRGFVARYAPEYAGKDLGLEALDAAWSSWMATSPTDTSDINNAINTIGISFGSLLIDSGEFKWCIAKDDWGTDLAVHALPERGDVLVYPANFVSKRWEDRTTDFLANGFLQILDHVCNLRKEWDKAKPAK
jgi:hypothetical protein